MNFNYRKLITPLIATLTLGLAPFYPEPHLFGKIEWVLGDSKGMNLMDWFDLAFHGAPWIWLMITLVIVFKEKFQDTR